MKDDFGNLADVLAIAHMACMVFLFQMERSQFVTRMWPLPLGPHPLDYNYKRGKPCDFLWPVGGFIEQVKL